MGKWPRYTGLVDSAVTWLGKVPSHWEVLPLKRRYSVVGGSTPKSENAEYWDGEIVWVTPADLSKVAGMFIGDSARHITTAGLDSCGTTLVPKRSVILSTRAPIGSVAVAEAALCVNQGCKALVPMGSQNPEFLAYALLAASADLNNRGRGTTFLELSSAALANFPLAFPPIDEQNAIVDFLNQETGAIDRLIGKQERLIDLLTEKITSIVTHSITRGDAKEIRLAHACNVISRPVSEETQESYVKLGLFNRGRGIFKRESTDSEDMGDSDFFWVRKGDLILSGQFAWEGAVALADQEHDGCVVSHRFPVIKGREGIAKTEYLLALLLTKYGDFLLNEHSRGAAGRNRPLNMNSLLKVKIPVIPVEKQNEVAYLVHLRKRIAEKVASQTQLLREHRASLISAVVTGKIRVTEDVQTPEMAVA